MNRISRRFAIIGLLLALILTISGCTGKEEGIVAKVDGDKITQEEFDSDFQVFKRISEQQLGEDAMSQVGEDGKTLEETLKQKIIEKLIMERIVEKESKKMNIEITSDEIQKQMEEYVKAMGGEEKFDEFLKNNHISKEFFEENLRKELLFNKYRDAFLDDIQINEKEVKKYFEENKEELIVVKASHILVKTEEEGKKVLKRLEAGEDFAKVASEVSIDKTSSMQGGSLPYFAKGDMIAEFEEAAFALSPGEISDLVHTEVGYHIIKVEDKKDTYEALKDDIVKVLKDDKYLEEMKELRNKAKVKILLDTKSTKIK
ncbi:peptidylprolyl isomerase [Tissierella praeacuta]|uniref:peptidylprolyl isomerase n=1 Tax=Tissierella praeacuta TaxID=43131 RepID=UPI0033410A5E